MSRVRMIHQTAATDCAPACLAMIAEFHRIGIGIEGVRERLDPGRDGVSGLTLRDAAMELGLTTRAVGVDPAALAAGVPDLAVPLIAHWQDNHYVVVESVGPRSVRLADPAVGRRVLRTAEFVAGATGLFFSFERPAATAAVDTPRSAHPVRVLRALPLGRFARTLLLALGVTAAMTLLGFAVPVATASITDALGADRFDARGWLVAGLVVASVMAGLAAGRSFLAAALQREVSQHLSETVARTLLTRTYRYFERRTLGDLFNRVNSARMIHELLGVVLVGSLLDGVLTAGYLIALLAWSPVLAGLTALVLVATLAVTALLAKRTATLHREELLLAAEADSLMVDAIAGVAALRVGGAEEVVLDRWGRRVRRRLAAGARRARTAGLGETVLSSVRVGAPIVFLVVAATHAPTPGTAIGLAALAGAVLIPLAGLSQSLVLAAEIRPLLERIADVTEAPTEPAGLQKAAPLTGAIELDGVCFRYDAWSADVLSGVSARIQAGWKVGIVGATGCGKSTLVALLTGLHEPMAGAIRYDGVDLAVLDRASVRAQLGVVQQDTWLGVGTIREAVAFGRDDIDSETVCRALKQAHLLDEVLAMPQGLETRLATGGRGISTGQRQRIALARALVGHPRVLILDEATSALDVTTEAAVEAHLRSLDITRLVIAHRLSTVADADWILVIDQGRVVEQGPPALLLAAQGEYAALVGTTAKVAA